MAKKPVNAAKVAKPVTARPALTTAQKCDAVGIASICEKIADCVPLRAIADDIGVSKGALIVWLATKPDQYARAREAQAEKHAEDILAISDELVVEGKFQGEDFKIDVSSSAVARNRLRVDTRKWLAARMAPKKYGERQQVDVNDVTPPKTIEEVRARLAELMAKASV